MFEDEQIAAVEYYTRIMTTDDVLVLKSLVSRVPRASKSARRYLERHCRNARELEEFFEDNSHCFFVENGRVALYREELERSSRSAVLFFQEKVGSYRDPVHYMKLKQEQLENAPEEIASFIASFYPGKEFKRFLQRRPEVFVVYPDKTVFLIETESVAFFERELETCEPKMPFLRFRGRIGQAKPHVQAYMNKNYPGDDFQVFLRRHGDVFVLDDDLNVSRLVPLD